MEIVVSEQQGRMPVTVFHLQGELDINTYQALEARARQAHENGMRNLVLDLGDVPFVSSAGIRAINNLFNLLRQNVPAESDEAVRDGLRAGTYKSPHLKLVNPTGAVKNVLSMAGLDMFLEIHADLASAIASF